LLIQTFKNANLDFNPTFLGELQSVGLKPEENLHDTLLVGYYNGREHFSFGVEGDLVLALFLLTDVGVCGEELNLLVDSLHPLDAHDLLDALDDVEWGNVLSEFV
jgi:hypothetical protein